MTLGDFPSAGRFDGRTHLLPVRIYYEDTDFSGVVYHGNYLRYFERGRSDFMRLAGVSHTDLLNDPDPTAFSVVKIAIEFKQAARIDDALLVRTTFDTVTGPRLGITQRLTKEDRLVALAHVEACCISLTGRAKRPPAAVVERLKPFLEAD
ncbi:MAG: YbgC/FadM family acyl-CoA thioesterase [Caulobacterales bacterium]|jgi:acyl-CoA thioester hydrolase